MKRFKITWSVIREGESFVEANSIEEARELALEGEDSGFEYLGDDMTDAVIENIEEVSDAVG
jgi:hypothetical protein